MVPENNCIHHLDAVSLSELGLRAHVWVHVVCF